MKNLAIFGLLFTSIAFAQTQSDKIQDEYKNYLLNKYSLIEENIKQNLNFKQGYVKLIDSDFNNTTWEPQMDIKTLIDVIDNQEAVVANLELENIKNQEFKPGLKISNMACMSHFNSIIEQYNKTKAFVKEDREMKDIILDQLLITLNSYALVRNSPEIKEIKKIYNGKNNKDITYPELLKAKLQVSNITQSIIDRKKNELKEFSEFHSLKKDDSLDLNIVNEMNFEVKDSVETGSSEPIVAICSQRKSKKISKEISKDGIRVCFHIDLASGEVLELKDANSSIVQNLQAGKADIKKNTQFLLSSKLADKDYFDFYDSVSQKAISNIDDSKDKDLNSSDSPELQYVKHQMKLCTDYALAQKKVEALKEQRESLKTLVTDIDNGAIKLKQIKVDNKNIIIEELDALKSGSEEK